MNILFFSILEAIVLSIAVSLDLFVASFSYGINKIKIPFLSAVTIDFICSLVLVLAVFIGNIITPFIPSHITKIISSLLLIFLGIIKIFDSYLKNIINKYSGIKKELKFSILDIKFILNIYANPENADSDYSKTLSIYEAISLAIALSLDGLAVGFGAGIDNVNLTYVLIASILMGFLVIMIGSFIGNKIAEKTDLNLSWIGGVLLIILGIIN